MRLSNVKVMKHEQDSAACPISKKNISIAVKTTRTCHSRQSQEIYSNPHGTATKKTITLDFKEPSKKKYRLAVPFLEGIATKNRLLVEKSKI